MIPATFTYDGEGVFTAAPRFRAALDGKFVIGERYVLEPVDEAQSARDRAYHSTIRDLWSNLREGDDGRWPNPTDFRRWLLIECGFCDTAKLAFASAKAALAALPFLQCEGAQLGVSGAVIVVRKPWSQKLRGGMSKEDRTRSYKATIELAESMIGVGRNTARAAA